MGMLLSRHYADNDTTENQGAAKKVAPSNSKSVEKEKKPVEKDEKGLTYTAKDIKMMNGAKLRKLAKESGIADPEELTVGELKSILTEKFS